MFTPPSTSHCAEDARGIVDVVVFLATRTWCDGAAAYLDSSGKRCHADRADEHSHQRERFQRSAR